MFTPEAEADLAGNPEVNLTAGSLVQGQPINTLRVFQIKCEEASKFFVVLLGFMIPVSTAGTHIVLSCILVSWFLAGNLAQKLEAIVAHPITRITLLLFGVYLIGAGYSSGPLADVTRMLGKMSKLLYLPFLLGILTESKWRENVIKAFLAAMLLTLILGCLKLYARGTIGHHQNFTLACVFKDHIYTNLMMSVASFILGHKILSMRTGWKRFAMGIFLASSVYYILFMSEGRTGYFIFVTLCGLWGLQRLSFRGILVTIMMLVILFTGASLISERFQSRWQQSVANLEKYQQGDTHTPIGARLEFYQNTWQLIKQHPWLGYGTGSFKEAYREHATAEDLQLTDNPHNEYLNSLFQIGIVGLMALLAFFGVILKQSFALSNPDKWLAQGALVAMMVGCLANSWIMDFTSGYFFVMLIAVSFGGFNLTQRSCV